MMPPVKTPYLGPYIARRKVIVPQGPGKTPRVMKFAKGDVFSFDGDEMIDINKLLRAQAIQPYTGDLAALEAING